MFYYWLYRDMTLNGAHYSHVRAFYAAKYGVVSDHGCVVEIRR